MKNLCDIAREYHGFSFPYESLQEWQVWLERAIRYGKQYQGICTRKLYIESKSELNYYQIGKIFRNQNIMSASRGTPTPNSTLYDLHTNVHIHIYSSSG